MFVLVFNKEVKILIYYLPIACFKLKIIVQEVLILIIQLYQKGIFYLKAKAKL